MEFKLAVLEITGCKQLRRDIKLMEARVTVRGFHIVCRRPYLPRPAAYGPRVVAIYVVELIRRGVIVRLIARQDVANRIV